MTKVFCRYQASQLTIAFGTILVAGIVVLPMSAGYMLRQQEIHIWSKQMSNSSLILAEHTSQTMASCYMALDGIASEVRAAGADSPQAFRKMMADQRFFRLLKDKTETLPQIDVATIVADNVPQLHPLLSSPGRRITAPPTS